MSVCRLDFNVRPWRSTDLRSGAAGEPVCRHDARFRRLGRLERTHHASGVPGRPSCLTSADEHAARAPGVHVQLAPVIGGDRRLIQLQEAGGVIIVDAAALRRSQESRVLDPLDYGRISLII